MRLTRATPQAIRYACLNFHYAKAIPVNVVGYNVYNINEEWCGCILYGSGANNEIGTQYHLPQGGALELVRVALNGKQECTTQAVAMSLKQLHKDVPLCRLVVSYADCDQSHLGTIYQATNWIYVGTMMQNKADGSWIVNGKHSHGRTISSWVKARGGLKGLTLEQFLHKYYDPHAYAFVTKGKRKYLYPLDKKMRKQIEPLSQPYPKADAHWVKIDRNTFKKEKEVGQ
jgi:hypothetical protein